MRNSLDTPHRWFVRHNKWIGCIRLVEPQSINYITEVEWIYAPDDDPDPPSWGPSQLVLRDLEDLGDNPKVVAYRIWAEVAAFGGWVNTAAMQDHGLAAELPPPGNVGSSTSSTK